MQLPGMLIEYLITGSCALIWMWVLSSVLGKGLPSISDTRLLLFLPAIYVVGMIIDYVARGLVIFIVKTVKALKKRKAKDQKNEKKRNSMAGSVSRAFVFLHSAELSKQYEMRSSRDR